jgi:LysR family nitrogen assimilation transcriptional regulator
LYFYHVAHGGSFTAAEASLDIAQSALSRQIRQLETDLGVTLLERRGHGVEPTATGRVLLKYATEVLDIMGTAVAEVNDSRLAPRDRLSLAASRPFSTTYIPDVLTRFSRDHPHIHVSVYEASSGQVYEMLTSGTVDLAVVLVQPNSPKISSVKLYDEDLLVTGRSDDPALEAPLIKRADLQSLNLMLPAAPFGTRGILDRYFEEGGFDIDPVLRFDSVSLMKEMIRRDFYCALLPEQACANELAGGEFVARPLRPALHRTLRLAQLRDRKQPNALGALRETLLSVVAERHH